MLSENLKTLRKARGLSQEELAVKVHVVRQTVSKWEKGLSVPDAETLIALAEAFEVPVSDLLGEPIREEKEDPVGVLAEKLEIINLQLARESEGRRKLCHGFCLVTLAALTLTILLLYFGKSPYLSWNYEDPELAAAGTILHGFEFVFVRMAPFLFAAAMAGAILTRKR